MGDGALRVVIKVCELGAGQESWSATVAIEAKIGEEPLVSAPVAVFYEGLRLAVDYFDEWGYAIFQLTGIQPPEDLTAQSHFEIRIQNPRHSQASPSFHPPVVQSALTHFLETAKRWPAELPLRGADLRGLYLTGAILKGVDLRGANLEGAKFWRSDLSGAILKQSNLRGVDFTGCKLDDADLEGADLSGATLEPASCEQSDFRRVRGLSSEALRRVARGAILDERQRKQLKQHARQKLQDLVDERRKQDEEDRTRERDEKQRKLGAITERATLREQSEREAVKALSLRMEASAAEKAKEVARAIQAAERFSQYHQNRKVKQADFTMRFLPAGSFTMGAANGESNAEPPHEVTLSQPFLLGETPVTQALWAATMGVGAPGRFQGPERPVDSISWVSALQFCNRLSRVEGFRPVYDLSEGRISQIKWDMTANGYRLPTEAEWEYAAKAGVSFIYPGSDEAHEVGWFKENSGGETKPVKLKTSNPWGFYDMAGNVWEWCFDRYAEHLYRDRFSSEVKDPIERGSDGHRVLRGGSWSYAEEGLQCAWRMHMPPNFKTNRLGFRVARTPTLRRR